MRSKTFLWFVMLIWASAVAAQQVSETDRKLSWQEYFGTVEEARNLGFRRAFSGMLGKELAIEVLQTRNLKISNTFVPDRYIFFLKKLVTKDVNGKPIFETQHALEISDLQGNKVLDGDDTNCKISDHPPQNIKTPYVIAIGKLSWRIPPSRGAYATSINTAWTIDEDQKRFVQIDPNIVKCEINEDRN